MATADELSIVCRESQVPEGIKAQKGWHCLKVAGKLPFELTGVLASVAAPLAAAGIPIFALATYDTDYVLIPAERTEATIEALRHAGHTVW